MYDSITDEIRATRRNLASQFGNDLELILTDIRQRESTDGRHYVTLPRRLATPEADEQTVAVERRNGASSDGKSTPAAH